MSRKRRIGWIAIAILVILANDCAVLTVAVGMSTSLIPEPTRLSPIYDIPATLTAIPTVVDVTATIAPTSTVVPTIAPTFTPIPTSTPTPTTDASEVAYMTSALVSLTAIRSDLMSVADLSTQASQNPYVVKNKTWKSEFYAAIDDMEEAGRQLSLLKAPAKFVEVQSWMNKLYPEIKAMNEDFRRGIEGFEAKWIREANGHLTNITDYVVNATDALDKVQ